MFDKGTCLHSLGFSFFTHKVGLIIFALLQGQSTCKPWYTCSFRMCVRVCIHMYAHTHTIYGCLQQEAAAWAPQGALALLPYLSGVEWWAHWAAGMPCERKMMGICWGPGQTWLCFFKAGMKSGAGHWTTQGVCRRLLWVSLVWCLH